MGRCKVSQYISMMGTDATGIKQKHTECLKNNQIVHITFRFLKHLKITAKRTLPVDTTSGYSPNAEHRP